MYAWGLNSKGMLGVGRTQSYVCKPQKCDGLDKIVQVSCGTKHTLFLDIFGHAFACGTNKHGRLGIDATQHSKVTQYKPVSVKLESRL